MVSNVEEIARIVPVGSNRPVCWIRYAGGDCVDCDRDERMEED